MISIDNNKIIRFTDGRDDIPCPHASVYANGAFLIILSVLAREGMTCLRSILLKHTACQYGKYSCEIWAARPVDMRSVDVSWNNACRKMFNACWRESVKPLQFYCSCLPASILVHQRRILVWLKWSAVITLSCIHLQDVLETVL